MIIHFPEGEEDSRPEPERIRCNRCKTTCKTSSITAACWDEHGVCPHCFDTKEFQVTVIEKELDGTKPRIVTNPVDMYWHMLTLREMDINENR